MLIDWAQSSEPRSMVAPYSLRATDVPSLSTSVAWEEVELHGTTVASVQAKLIDRIARLRDLAGPALTLVQSVA